MLGFREMLEGTCCAYIKVIVCLWDKMFQLIIWRGINTWTVVWGVDAWATQQTAFPATKRITVACIFPVFLTGVSALTLLNMFGKILFGFYCSLGIVYISWHLRLSVSFIPTSAISLSPSLPHPWSLICKWLILFSERFGFDTVRYS